ncbi:MAG: hypothetical protein QMC21_10475 [Flavobacteriales bacterium]|jgi:hypothetical protein|tara:strand:- start:101 stop:445 length:345 start_codon:yes stop_codon:yes gene_type:complete
MEDKVNQNISEKENQKLEKIAFISILLALVYIFLKFFNYIYTSSFILDSVLIPDYTIKFALKESFYSGLILSFGIIITFYLYKRKKYFLVIMLNAIFIVQSLALPYILHIANNY